MKRGAEITPPGLRYNILIVFHCLIAFFIQSCLGGERPFKAKADACAECDVPKSFVRLQKRGGDQGKLRFTHPLILSPEDWGRILDNIHVQGESPGLLLFSGKGTVERAFSPDENIFLSKALSKAFAQVQPDKLVVFGLRKARSPGLNEVTTGGWFVEGTHLHLLLANYRFAVATPSIMEILWRDPFFNNAPHYYNLVPGEYQALGTAGKLLGSTMKSDIPGLSINYKAFIGKTVQMEKQEHAIFPSAQKQGSSVEQRLRTLMRLKDNGLVTEEEFLEKRKELLGGL